jgi:hypothetical protein
LGREVFKDAPHPELPPLKKRLAKSSTQPRNP